MLWMTLAWGSCFVAISIGLQDAPLLWLAALRALIAGIALLLVTGMRRTPLPRDRRTWVLIVLPAGLGTGAWLSLSSAVAVTIGTLISRVVRADPFVVAAAQLLIGGSVLAIAAVVIEGPPTINWNVRFVLTLLFLSLVGTAATTVAWFTEARRARLDILTTWTLLVPIFGIALSLMVLGERQSLWGWVGTAVVVVSMLLLVVPHRRSRSSHTDQAPRPCGGRDGRTLSIATRA